MSSILTTSMFLSRLNDGGLSLTTPGAIALHSLDGILPKIVSIDDAVPFLRNGRNVIHGFIIKAEDTVRHGIPVLIVDTSDDLVAHGIPLVRLKRWVDSEKALQFALGAEL